MSSAQQLSRSRRSAGRPSKGDRLDLFVRVATDLHQKFADEAVSAAVSQSDHMAAILADRYYWRCLDDENQGRLAEVPAGEKIGRADLSVRVPRDLRHRFAAEAKQARVSQSNLMTDILTERYSQRRARGVASMKIA